MNHDPLKSPEYLAAVERERVIRDAAFMPVNERIGVFEVLPMTLRHYLLLRMVNSPLLVGRTPAPLEAAAFLWILNPEFSPCAKARKRFMSKCRNNFIPIGWFNKARRYKAAQDIINKSLAFVEEVFNEAPPGNSNEDTCKEYFSDAAFICARFAREYGWDDEATLDKPLKRIFQYLKEHRQHVEGKKAILFNSSDKLLMEVKSA